MKQMYLLTVILNLGVGFWFVLPWLTKKYHSFSDIKKLGEHTPVMFKMVFSIFLLAFALVKMLFFSYGVIIIGDLFPSLTLIFASIILLSEVLEDRPETLPLHPKVTNAMEVIRNKHVLIGFICLVAGLAHFLLADVILF